MVCRLCAGCAQAQKASASGGQGCRSKHRGPPCTRPNQLHAAFFQAEQLTQGLDRVDAAHLAGGAANLHHVHRVVVALPGGGGTGSRGVNKQGLGAAQAVGRREEESGAGALEAAGRVCSAADRARRLDCKSRPLAQRRATLDAPAPSALKMPSDPASLCPRPPPPSLPASLPATPQRSPRRRTRRSCGPGPPTSGAAGHSSS